MPRPARSRLGPPRHPSRALRCGCTQPPPRPRSPMKKLLLVVLGAAVAAAGAGCRDQNAAAATAPPSAPTVSVVTIAPERVAIAGEWIATLDGIVNAQIRPQVSGYLVRRAY